MWIIYRKKERTIAGIGPICEPDLEKETALTSVIKGLPEAEPLEHYDALQVSDRVQAGAFMAAYPYSLVLRETAPGELQPVIEIPKRFSLGLSCDAPDAHPVDGIPEIPADGVSFTTIRVQKLDELGELQKGKGGTDQFYLRTDYGTLWSDDGKAQVDTIKLKKGEAAFRLVSETNRRVANVQVFNADSQLSNATIRIEFIAPPV